MNFRHLTLAALITVSTTALADGHFDRTLTVSANPDLYVATGSGNIHIHAGSGSQIQINAHVHSGWSAMGSLDDKVTRIIQNPPIVQEGNVIKVGMTTDRDLYNHITIDYDIAVPTSVALNLKSGSGDLTIDGGARYLTASSGSGNIHAHGLHGTVALSTGSGDIELDQDAPGDITTRSGSGNIRIHGLQGGLAARTGSGNITADGRLTGPANIGTGSGNVNLHLGPDAHFNLEASVGSGDIHIGFPNAPHTDEHSRHHLTAPVNGGGPALEARTGSGNIDISN